MTISATAILTQTVTPMEIAKALIGDYGADPHFMKVCFTTDDRMFQISFLERWTDEERALRPHARPKRNRTLSVFVDGHCMADYADVHEGPATLLSFGASGDSDQILLALTRRYGGYYRKYDDHPWQQLTAAAMEPA